MEKSLYETICDIAENAVFVFDLKEKTMKNGRTTVIDNTKILDTLKLENGEEIILPHTPILSEREMKEPFDRVQELYDQYRVSFPSNTKVKSNFIALRSDEMTFEELRKGIPRNLARTKLEAYILLGSIHGIFKWKDETHWFYHGERGLILYREWLGGKNNAYNR